MNHELLEGRLILALTRGNTTEHIELADADAAQIQKLLTNYLSYRDNQKAKEVHDAPAG